ncbi:unnamed protein product, partial [Heterosigma akashiwo]
EESVQPIFPRTTRRSPGSVQGGEQQQARPRRIQRALAASQEDGDLLLFPRAARSAASWLLDDSDEGTDGCGSTNEENQKRWLSSPKGGEAGGWRVASRLHVHTSPPSSVGRATSGSKLLLLSPDTSHNGDTRYYPHRQQGSSRSTRGRLEKRMSDGSTTPRR